MRFPKNCTNTNNRSQTLYQCCSCRILSKSISLYCRSRSRASLFSSDVLFSPEASIWDNLASCRSTNKSSTKVTTFTCLQTQRTAQNKCYTRLGLARSAITRSTQHQFIYMLGVLSGLELLILASVIRSMLLYVQYVWSYSCSCLKQFPCIQ